MSPCILIVDDDAELRSLYRLILSREGFTVDEAINGAEALKYLMSHTPDVIIMDILMPMLGGEAVMQRIQQMPSLNDVQIIVLTAYPRFKESAQFLRADHFLVKPIKPEALLETVHEALAEEPFVEE